MKKSSIGEPQYVKLSDSHMIRTERDVVTPLKPISYKRYVNDIYNLIAILYLNSYIKLAVKSNPKNF